MQQSLEQNDRYMHIKTPRHVTNTERTFTTAVDESTNLLVAVVTLPTGELQTLLHERIVGQEIGAG